jgi:MtaA/CmuA family methyltransferase
MMTPKRRFLAGILGGRVDRTPVGNPVSVATVEQMELTGAYFPEVHQDAVKMARLAAGAFEILGYDAIMPVFSIDQEAAALGAEVDWGAVDSMPVARTHPWQEPQQVHIPADFLECASTRTVLDAISILRREYGHRVAIIGKVMGPWTLAYLLHGLEPFLIETLDNPDKVRRFLDQLKRVTMTFGQAQIAAGGAPCIAIFSRLCTARFCKSWGVRLSCTSVVRRSTAWGTLPMLALTLFTLIPRMMHGLRSKPSGTGCLLWGTLTIQQSFLRVRRTR